MIKKLCLDSTIRAFIVNVLATDTKEQPLFGRTSETDNFFKDLLSVGCDFYDLLELFINCDAITKHATACIVENVPSPVNINDFSNQTIRKMVPHWTSSPHRDTSVADVCNELREVIRLEKSGTFVYNNKGTKQRRTYNDLYLLIISDNDKYFFDINRRKAFRICKDGKEMEL